MTKILVCGDRYWASNTIIQDKIVKLRIYYEDLTIIHGDCRGADKIADAICKKHGIDVVPYPAKWAKHGRAAGPIRNRQMLDEKPVVVLAFHDVIAKSKGTKDTVMEAIRRGIKTHVYNSQGKEVTEEVHGGNNRKQSRITDKV